MNRSWSVLTPVTNERLQSRIDAAGYTAKVEGDCSTGSCTARGTARGWKVAIVAVRNPNDPTTHVSLWVQH